MSLYGWVSQTVVARVIQKNSCYCLYSCVNLLAPPDDLEFLKTARAIYRQQEKYAQALNLSIRVGDMELIKEDFEQCPDP